MALTGGKRKISVIMFTDIAGYTALTQENETQTLWLLEEQRKVMRPLFSAHHGVEIKTIGDAFLVEFESALDATVCALEVQKALRLWSDGDLAKEGAKVRIGVHLGDVVRTQDDVYGDAVNVASRIEGVAEPGGVCISQQVFDQVRNKLDFDFEKVEGPGLKNVAFPISVYRVTPPGAAPKAVPGAAGTNRVAVLPLANLSQDPGDEYIADSMTEELITSLSAVKGLRVIARTSVMQYKKGGKSVSEIGRALGVSNIVEGSVQKAGKKIRINIQLIDARSEEHLWANRYDKNFDDVFKIQDDIAHKVTKALRVRLAPDEQKGRPTKNMDAYAHYLRGRRLLYDRTEQSLRAAKAQFESAAQKDPKYAEAYSGLADAFYLMGYYNFSPLEDAYAKAKQLADQALSLNSKLPEAHATTGVLLDHYYSDFRGAEAAFKKAIQINPSYALAHHWYAVTLLGMGRLDEGVQELSRAKEADPLSPLTRTIRGAALYWAKRDEEALAEWKGVEESDPGFHILYYQRALYYVDTLQEGLAFSDIEKRSKIIPEDEVGKFLTGYADARFRRTEPALGVIAQFKELARQGHPHSPLIAYIYAALGDSDAFFEWAERAVDEHSFEVLALRYMRMYQGIREDARYAKLLQRMGLDTAQARVP